MKTREQIRDEYRQNFPLLAAYEDIVQESWEPGGSINEPARGGINREKAVLLALDRVGRPARDREDVWHAEAWIEHLCEEMAAVMPPVERKLTDHVIDALFPFAGCVPTADAWQATDPEDRNGDLAEIVAGIRDAVPADGLYRVLLETLEFAMPAILRQVTADDAARRAPRIREADIVAVRERVRLVAVVSEYVVLDGAGDVLTGLCPFDDEATRTFSVDTSRDLYHCTRCGEGGDVITFVMKIEHLGFAEAVERLARRTP
jgi:hypothetical protein